MGTTQEQLAIARSAKKSINTASTALKNQALEAMASQLLKATEVILAANQIDMEAARGKISEVMLQLGKRWIRKSWKMVLNSRKFALPWVLLASFMKAGQM